MKRLPLLAFALLASCSQGTPRAADNADPTQAQASTSQPARSLPLTIRTPSATHRFTVEVALTPEEQAQGLMFRTSLAPDGGMLFPMSPPRTASFWMKNTPIPLDIIFIHTDGSIAYIKANSVPYSRDPVSAGVPVAAVLELAGGRAAELGIGEGDRVQWGDCATPAPPGPLRLCTD